MEALTILPAQLTAFAVAYKVAVRDLAYSLPAQAFLRDMRQREQDRLDLGAGCIAAGRTWANGACYPFAVALQRLLGGELVAVGSRVSPDFINANHIMLSAFGLLLDATDAWTEPRLRKAWLAASPVGKPPEIGPPERFSRLPDALLEEQDAISGVVSAFLAPAIPLRPGQPWVERVPAKVAL